MTQPCTCADFEAGLSDYRDGTLPPPQAAALRLHLAQCPACAQLLAAVAAAISQVRALPQLEPPARLFAAIAAQTLSRPARRARPARLSLAQLWTTVTSPRFALGLAMSVFAFSLLLNAAQINLRQVMAGDSLSQLAPANLTGLLQRKVVRTWARGVSYYRDLRVVYEIEAAVHQMRQTAAPPESQPSGHDHTQTVPSAHPDAFLAAIPALPILLSRRTS